MMGDAVSFGDWYVVFNTNIDADPNRDTNFDVGHADSGARLCQGVTFWEGRRIALALDDAGVGVCVIASRIYIDLDRSEGWLLEAIIGSALMDHYVFPLEPYLPSCGAHDPG